MELQSIHLVVKKMEILIATVATKGILWFVNRVQIQSNVGVNHLPVVFIKIRHLQLVLAQCHVSGGVGARPGLKPPLIVLGILLTDILNGRNIILSKMVVLDIQLTIP